MAFSNVLNRLALHPLSFLAQMQSSSQMCLGVYSSPRGGRCSAESVWLENCLFVALGGSSMPSIWAQVFFLAIEGTISLIPVAHNGYCMFNGVCANVKMVDSVTN
jgi:hypothetical protein